MGVVTVYAPGGEDALSKTVFTGSADVIHDFVAAIFDYSLTNAVGNIIQNPVPRDSFPFSLPAFAGALEWVKNAVGILNLVKGGRAFGAVAAARSGMLGIAFKLLNVAGNFVDVGQQTASGLAIEAGCRD